MSLAKLDTDDGVLIVEMNDPRKEAPRAREEEEEEQMNYTPTENDLDNENYVQKNEVVRRKLSSLVPTESQASTVLSQSSIGSSTDSQSTALAPTRRQGSSSSSRPGGPLIRRKTPESPSLSSSTTKTLLPSLATLLSLLAYLISYSSKSATLGFCDTNAFSNSILFAQSQAVVTARECVRRHANGEEVGSYGTDGGCDASALPLIPFLPSPEACTPCPAHAVCADGELVACDKEYLLQPTFVGSILPSGGSFLNGFPGLGSVAFPPACVPDTEKLRLVGGMARAIESALAKERGEMVCVGGKPRDENVKEFGIDEAELRDQFIERRDVRRSSLFFVVQRV
jgi:hypothetical protein